MYPSKKLERNRRKFNADIKRVMQPKRLIKLSARDLWGTFAEFYDEARELFDLEEWIKLNGDGWSKDDWPHAQGRGQARSVCLS